MLAVADMLLERRLALRLLGCLPLAPLAPRALRPAVAEDAPTQGFMTEEGLRYFDFGEGQGEPPRWGQLLRIHYVGYTVDPTGSELKKFDSTYDRKETYLIKHGNGQTILGMEQALHTMRPGGRRRVIVPSGKLSYITDKGPLPPTGKGRDKMFKAIAEGDPLVFDVELVKVMTDVVDRGDYDDGEVSDLLARLERLDAERAAESGGNPTMAGEMNSPADVSAEAKRRQLEELGLSPMLNDAGEEAAAAKKRPAAESEAEAKRRQLAELGLSPVLSDAGQEAARAKQEAARAKRLAEEALGDRALGTPGAAQ